MNITKTTPREIILIQRDICEELWKEDGPLSEELLNELDDINGILDGSRFYPAWEFDERMKNYRPSELAPMISDGWSSTQGGGFNLDQGYFAFARSGELVSAEWCDYTWAYDDGCMMNSLLEYRNQLHTLDEWDELTQLLDELAEAKEFWEENA